MESRQYWPLLRLLLPVEITARYLSWDMVLHHGVKQGHLQGTIALKYDVEICLWLVWTPEIVFSVDYESVIHFWIS